MKKSGANLQAVSRMSSVVVPPKTLTVGWLEMWKSCFALHPPVYLSLVVLVRLFDTG